MLMKKFKVIYLFPVSYRSLAEGIKLLEESYKLLIAEFLKDKPELTFNLWCEGLIEIVDTPDFVILKDGVEFSELDELTSSDEFEDLEGRFEIQLVDGGVSYDYKKLLPELSILKYSS